MSVFSLASLNLTTMGEERINSDLLNLPDFTWAIPQECGLKCAFYFKYDAPALECRDVIFSDDQDPPNLYAGDYIYETSTNLYPQNLPSQQIDVDAPYYLSINYTNVTNAFLSNQTLSRRAGTYCRFYQATYNASFELNTNSSTQRASTSIISPGDYLSLGKTAANTTSFNELGEKSASWAVCYAFALAFRGSFAINSLDANPGAHPVIASIFKLNESPGSFELAVSNLSQTLVDLFSNLTLSLLSSRGGQDPVIANATTWDGSSVWIYTPRTLLETYLPAVILAAVVALYGLYTIHVNGIAMDDKFSSFLLATQNAELSEMCGEAAGFEELRRLQLIHQKKGTFVIVDSGPKSPN